MSNGSSSRGSSGSGSGTGADWERKRRLAEIFGDALPETTRDERDPDDRAEQSGRSGRGESAGDRWLKAQVPPHHGG